MKRRSIIALSVAAALIVIGSIICGSAFAFNGFDITRFDTNNGYEQMTAAPEGEFSSVDISVSFANVKIATAHEFKIDYNQSENDKYSIALENGVLKITQSSNKEWHNLIDFNFGKTNYELLVYLPEKNYDNIAVKSGSGDIYVNAVCSKDYSFEAQSGDIELIGLSGDNVKTVTSGGEISATALQLNGELNIKTESGDIETENIIAEKTEITASSGDCEVDNHSGNTLSINTQSGEISADNISISGVLITNSQSGSQELDIVNAASIELSSASGEIEAETALECFYQVNTKSGSISTPPSSQNGISFKVTTQSGDVDIERADFD